VLNWYKENVPKNFTYSEAPEVWNIAMSPPQLTVDKIVEKTADLRSEERKSFCMKIVDSAQKFIGSHSEALDKWNWEEKFVKQRYRVQQIGPWVCSA